jgi:hypothetical protein
VGERVIYLCVFNWEPEQMRATAVGPSR